MGVSRNEHMYTCTDVNAFLQFRNYKIKLTVM